MKSVIVLTIYEAYIYYVSKTIFENNQDWMNYYALQEYWVTLWILNESKMIKVLTRLVLNNFNDFIIKIHNYEILLFHNLNFKIISYTDLSLVTGANRIFPVSKGACLRSTKALPRYCRNPLLVIVSFSCISFLK